MVAAAIVLLCACEDTPTAPTRGPLPVAGVVLDFTTRAPLSSATVVFERPLGVTITSRVTDNSGRFSANLPDPGEYLASVNNRPAGIAIVNRQNYPADLFVDTGTCIVRYGTVTDARTALPIRDTTLTLGGVRATSTSDGWYTIDLGCPPSGFIGSGTTVIQVSHPLYEPFTRVVGRGVALVTRLDISLVRAR
jgi:hypothetical protein